jgi:Na+-translocating ferredoxin:NAD+ oxidoreductase RnfC subunit
MLTIAGAVKLPATLRVPIGTTFRECIEFAGGLATEDPVLCLGGLMMGTHTDDLDTPVTKTSTGVVILPRAHHLIERKLKPDAARARIGKSACDQCRACTEYCPRFLLGYAVEPHQVMRTLAFTGKPARIISTSGRPCAVPAACARCIPARRNCFPRRPATTPRP